MKLDIAGDSHVGCVRDNNEDAWLVHEDGSQALLVVADGVGGREAGEVASQTSVEIFGGLAESGKLRAAADASMAPSILDMAAQRAHGRVSKLGVESKQELSMSCTLTAALINDGRVDIVQVGDSRAYRWDGSVLVQLTEDQTVAWQLWQDGRIEREQIARHPDRNTLSQSIGLESAENPFEPAHVRTELEPGDGLLLCSDGLTDRLDDEALGTCIAKAGDSKQAVSALIEAALEAGGHDNVTVVFARVKPDDDA